MKPCWRIGLACAAFFLTAGTALAQYAWIGDNGVRQYSDRPPPASVPAQRILKAPGMNSQVSAASSTASAPDAAAPSLAQREAAFRQRGMERQEADKKAAEDSRLAAERARNCEQARSYQRTLESGTRIARTAENGERSFLSDAERTREMAQTQRMLSECS